MSICIACFSVFQSTKLHIFEEEGGLKRILRSPFLHRQTHTNFLIRRMGILLKNLDTKLANSENKMVDNPIRKINEFESNGLLEILFSWSVEDICNADLYKYKVERIPEYFHSVEQYLSSFTYPLIEDTRSELCSMVDLISELPYAEVISIQKSESVGYDLKDGCWRNTYVGSGKKPYKPNQGDLLLLSVDWVPKSVTDLDSRRTWSLALVTDVDDDMLVTSCKVQTSETNKISEGMQNSLFAVFLTNVTSKTRVWNALHMSKNMEIIGEVLVSQVKEDCNLCSSQGCSIWPEIGGAELLSFDLNESQKAAVAGLVKSVQCNHRPSVELVWGSPGTGKTAVASILLYALLKSDCRTLACGPTNVAVAEFAWRVLKLVKEPSDLYLGKINSACSLGNLLLFGSDNSLCDYYNFKEIDLNYRVDRLLECFSPLTGWTKCSKDMIDFLEKFSSQYLVFLEKISGDLFDAKKISDIHCSFLEFTIKQYRALALILKECTSVLCNHLSDRYILQNKLENLVRLPDLLESFDKLLFQNDIIDDELEEVFARLQIDGTIETLGCDAFRSCTSSTLYNLTSECIGVLRSLQHSLHGCFQDLKDRNSVIKFCFQNASLIFCSASNSYYLQNMEMEPLDVLVIDQAAQLKECESMIPLQLKGIRHAVLFGDDSQLPGMVNNKVADSAGFGRSLFERLSSMGHSKHHLNIQHRMLPKISYFPSSVFYQGAILDAPNVCCESYDRKYLPGPIFGPYSFINISDGREELDNGVHGWRNLVEVAIIMKIVRNLYKACQGSKLKLEIGIISQYDAQVTALQEKLFNKYENFEGFTLRIKTVDDFQGGEADIVIFSTVRCNGSESIGLHPRCWNVALTRARHSLWILGNDKVLSYGGSFGRSLVQDAKNRRCFFNADEDEDLCKVILDAKEQLDQLDDLLNENGILFKSSRWKVHFSDKFKRSFLKLKSRQTQKLVIALLLKLSSGWRPKKVKIDSLNRSPLLVRQFKVQGDLYIVSTVDIAKCLNYTQVLKIWDVLPLVEIPALLMHLDNVLCMYTSNFISQCNQKHIEGKLEVPMNWDTLGDIVRYKKFRNEAGCFSSKGESVEESHFENSKVGDSLLLMKFYSLSSGVMNRLLCASDGTELELPFEVTDQESDVIVFPESTFILGRSGTGKTTVLTMKMIRLEQQHYFSSVGTFETENNALICASYKSVIVEDLTVSKGPQLRQIFVSVSPKLCSAVKNHVVNLKSLIYGGCSLIENSATMMFDMDDSTEFKDIPDSFSDIQPEYYPLVITFHKFLMMLDGSMENSYFDRFRDVRELSQGTTSATWTSSMHALIRSKEVNYERFHSFYWSHLNCQLTKNLDSSVVFIEIMSHIKGGVIGGRVPDGALTRDDYLSLSEGRASTLNREMREIVYHIYLDYEKKKLLNGEFDLGDLVIDIRSRLKNGCYQSNEMHYVYIDEVQDLTMRQISLFKYICGNVMEGYVFSGDTAQTVARGVDFRFEDIRSLFYNEFTLDSESNRKVKGERKKDKCCISDTFHLNQNFRSHTGVLKLSQSVLELLYYFFPLSVDKLSAETSFINGEAPVLLESENQRNPISTIFDNGVDVSGSIIGFGAEQVILVRDDFAKKEICSHVGKKALVLTIVESKGLEFQDVLLYNFFGTSPLKNIWRLVYGYMKEKNLLDSTNLDSFPCFSEGKHKILCSELKQLYVAITRTKQRLWVYENIEEFSNPIFDYWKKLQIVQVRKLDDSLAHEMRTTSTNTDWNLRGIKLFNEGNFEMAALSFQRSGDSFKEKWAKAAGLRASADRMRGLNFESARVALLEAASIYEAIGKFELAANCLIQSKEYKRAGMLYLEKFEETKLEDAGDCFSLAGCCSTAADIYCRASLFSKCLSVCTKGKLFEMGLNFIKTWRKNSNLVMNAAKTRELRDIEQAFLEKWALHYHHAKDISNMMIFVQNFNSIDVRRTFLWEWNHLHELVLIESEVGNFLEAARISRLKGDLLLEADMFEKSSHFEDATRSILSHILVNSAWGKRSKGWPLKTFTNKEELISKVKLLAKKKSDFFYRFVHVEARSLSDEVSNISEMGHCLSDSQRVKNGLAGIITCRKILEFHLVTELANYEWKDYVVFNLENNAKQSFSKKRVSVETLVYAWNIWKSWMTSILEYLNSVGEHRDKDNERWQAFCFSYLGLSKLEVGNRSNYLVLNSNAYWTREVEIRSLPKIGNLVSMDAHQFASAARNYWVSEVTSLGMCVVDKLNSLYKLSVERSFPIFIQGKTALYLHTVSKWFTRSKVLVEETLWAKEYMLSCRAQFLELLCPMDSKLIMVKNLKDLKGTDMFNELFLDALFDIVWPSSLSNGKIGKAVMFMFASGCLTDKLCEVIDEKFDLNPHWQLFIEKLKLYFNSGQIHESLLSEFQDALRDTFNVNWREEVDFVSPFCYVYLLERLLFIESSCQGKCFTTKSYFVEALSCKNWNSISTSFYKSGFHESSGGSYQFVAGMIKDILTSEVISEWLEKTNVPAENYNLLVQRLVILLCLVCVNCGHHFDLLYDLLERSEVSSQLPYAFLEIIVSRREASFDSFLAKALFTIGNPLVIFIWGNNHQKYIPTDAIVIDMNVTGHTKDITRILFSKNTICEDNVVSFDYEKKGEHLPGNNAPEEEKQLLGEENADKLKIASNESQV
ncbi:hypothetical protein MKW98_024239 [Papaver atlanticum]|uniref:UvrD-like helicase ATP-binding domain-containing protein n=1 Tax=Papaver atlanticum TaxID=357466 RepID=A0AAD4SY62_9MAGN|nr:hypothetical protein MKW98_024239 [Papaver atlanticum]